MTTLTLRGYARHRRAAGLVGGTLEAVRKAIKRGWVRLDDTGRLDPAEADRSWARLHVPKVLTDGRVTSAQVEAPARPRRSRHERPAPDNLMSPPLAALYELRAQLAELTGPLFRLSGKRADLEAMLTAWQRFPELLLQLEDGMAAAGVPLLAKDMPAGQEAAQ